MFWFLMYCAWSGLFFFFVGAKGMSLHWFWNDVFSLLASGTFTYSIHRVLRSRLCPARLRRGINSQKSPKELRSTVEAAFGTTPDLKDPADAWGAGFFACVPLLVVAYVYLGFVIQSGIWRFLCAFVVGIPLAVIVGKLVNAIAGQKRMLEKAKQVITDHNPQIWKEMTQAWNDRKKAQAKADVAAAQARAAQLEFPTKWLEMSQKAGDVKSLAWLAACHLLHAERVNIHRTVEHVMAGEVSSYMTWEASKAEALVFGGKALKDCHDERGQTFCRALLARAEALQSSTVPVTKSEGMSTAIGIFMTHYEFVPEELAILGGKQTLEDLSHLVSTIPGSQWLVGFGGISQVGGKDTHE